MKIKILDLGKNKTGKNILKLRNAPDFILEAYDLGMTNTINEYYKIKEENKERKSLFESAREKRILVENDNRFKEFLSKIEKTDEILKLENILNEARNREEDFLKAFYRYTNADIFTGGKRVPAKASRFMQLKSVKDLGEDFKKYLREFR